MNENPNREHGLFPSSNLEDIMYSNACNVSPNQDEQWVTEMKEGKNNETENNEE